VENKRIRLQPSESPLKKCPVCGGSLTHKEAEVMLRGGSNVAVVIVRCEVCDRCPTQLHSVNNITTFHDICKRLEKGETSGFKLLGQFFQIELSTE